jgi:hypothetical protein
MEIGHKTNTKAGEPRRARRRSESRQRTAIVALRLLPQERDALAKAARSRGITLSELIRSGAMEAAECAEPALD